MNTRRKDILWPAIALVVALLLRYLMVENTELALHCDVHRFEGWCALRTPLVVSFFRQDLGVVALLVALLGCWKQSRLVARWALTLAMAGLILYAYQPAAVAALVSAMLLARINARERGEDSELAV